MRSADRLANEGDLMTSQPRLPNHVSVCYPIEFYHWDKKKSACILEIGPDGVFLESEEVFSPGSMLTLRIDLPQAGCRFTVLGKVVATPNPTLHSGPDHASAPATANSTSAGQKSGMYVAFMDISPSNQERIHAYMVSHQKCAAVA